MAASVPPAPQPEAESFEPRYLRLGEILIERGKIEAEDLERALELQQERGDKIGKILVDMGLLAQRDVLAALSEQLGMPLVSIEGPPPSAPEIDGLSHRFLRQCRAFPVSLTDSTLTVAMADPLDFETVAAVRAFSGLQIQTLLAPEQEFAGRHREALRRGRAATAPRWGWTKKPAPISSTCATWRARRR